MSYLSDAHSEWHTVNGRYAICPLDCGAMSPEDREAEDAYNAEMYALDQAEQEQERWEQENDYWGLYFRDMP